MDLFTYLMAKNGNNTSVHGDLFSYLLGKGQSQTYTVSGVTIYIPNAKKLVSFMMTKESTQATSILPDGYTQVDYIESSGTQYIDTGYIVNQNTEIYYKGGQKTSTGAFFGVRTAESQRRYFLASGNNVISFYYNNADFTRSNIQTGTYTTGYITNYNWKVNNENVENYTISIYPTYSLYLFSLNQVNSPTAFSTSRLYEFKIIENNVIIKDFIPCYRNSDNEVGLYDLANNVFYTNQGTGVFTYGSVAQLPNPDFPVEVKTVKGSVDVKVVGKNLFNKEKAIDNREIHTVSTGEISYLAGWFVTDYIKVIPNTTYQVSGKSNGNAILYYDNNKTFILGVNSGGTSSFTTPNNAYYAILNGLMTQKDTFQLEQGTVATTYESYQEKTTTIPLNNNEIVGIGDYKDELKVDKSGHVFINKKTGKVVFNGSESGWTYDGASNYPIRINVTNAIFTTSNDIPPLVLCNYYKPFQWSIGNNRPNYGTTATANTNRIVFRNIDITSLANWKTWLSTHNTEVYYVLETPELIDLQTKVDLSLFKGVNNVSNSEDGYMTIQYR